MVELSEVDLLAIELARTREYVRSTFPTLAHNAYGKAQKDFRKVDKYVKECFEEARRKGLIRAPSSSESPL